MSMFFSGLGIVLGFTALIYFSAVKGWNLLISAFISSMVVLILNGIFDPAGIWANLSAFSTNGASMASNFVLVMPVGAIFGRFMQVSGFAESIAQAYVKKFGRGAMGVTLACYCLCCLLVLGGIHVIVSIFTVWPIMYSLAKETDLPTPHMMGIFAAGGSTWALGIFPGTPQAHNLTPIPFLGSNATAAPILGIVGSIICIILTLLWFKYDLKTIKKKDKHFKLNPQEPIAGENTDVTKWWVAMIPLLIPIVIIFLLNRTYSAYFCASIGMTISIIYVWIVCRKKLVETVKESLSIAVPQGYSAIMGIVAVVGFGTVMRETIAYQAVVDGVLGADLSPYTLAALGTSVVCGLAGSSSGGMLLALQMLAEPLIASGANIYVLHRIISVAAVGLDVMPHNIGVVTYLSRSGLSYADGYWPIVKYAMVIPVITLVAMTVLANFGVC